MTGLTDIPHYALFRILDYLQADCERRNKNEHLNPIKYADIYNFGGTCKGLRRIVWFWSRSMYDRLEINLLQDEPIKHLTVKFEEIHKSLKEATQKKVDKYLDIYIRAMMKNPLLKTLTLSHNTQSYFGYHEYLFDEIVLAICGQSKRECLDDIDRLPKVKEITVDIAGRTMDHLIALANTGISKLSLTASFAISDLMEFCARNAALVTLEINAHSFSDQGQLNQIVGLCPALKQLKFVMSDNARDTEYVKLALLERLQHLEIAKQPAQIMDFGWDEDHNVEEMASKRSRMDTDYEDNSPLENSTPLLLLIKALSERKRSNLVQLHLMFNVNDSVAQAIAQLKGLRMLECGFCHLKSIRHLKQHPTLKKLTIRNRDHIITDNVADLLREHVIVSNPITQMSLNPRGHLFIDTKDAVLLSFVNFKPLLGLEKLKTLGLSKDLLVAMERDLSLFLERGVQIQSVLRIILQPKSRDLTMLYERDYLDDEIPLPLVRGLRSFKLVSVNVPTIRFLETLIHYHRETLLEICIRPPYTIYRSPKEYYPNKFTVVALSFLSSLRKVSCGYRELEYIQPLARLRELEEIEVLSEHHPMDIPWSIVPILQNCRKFSSFKIKVHVSLIDELFVVCLQCAVQAHRDTDLKDDLDFCLRITEPITTEQRALFSVPFKFISLRTELVENDYLLKGSKYDGS